MTTLKVQRSVALVVEENDAARAFLADNLLADGLEVVCAHTAGIGLDVARVHVPDIALVAVNGGGGRDFAKLVRAGDAEGVDRRLPMILLGGDRHEIDELRALDTGADDYVPRACGYPVLLARVRALLRRVELDTAPRNGPQSHEFGALTLDESSRECTLDGQPVELSQKEYLLLRELMLDPGAVRTKADLMTAMKIRKHASATRTLDSHACRLRNKLGRGWIVNVWGVGYRLTDAARVTA